MMTLLAFTPFFDPLPALYPTWDEYWLWLVVPLVLAISIIYKGTRIERLRRLPWEACVMSVQILVLMVVASVILSATYWAAIRVL
jgi:hypothetical protein